jgi:hypothetical protein
VSVDTNLNDATTSLNQTCRARRVKCDEGWPACRRCISTSRVCKGYGIWGGGGSPHDQQQPQSGRALSIYCTPVPVGNLSREEQTHFDWFVNKTREKFAGLFTSDFWGTLVFQASAREPAVRHAVVALSAAHRFEIGCDPWVIPAIYGVGVEKFTLQQYNKAISHLRVATGKSGQSGLYVALITCMIFVVLEYLRGQYQMASAHLHYGIQLLSNISVPLPRSSMSPRMFSPVEDFVHNTLAESYARLSLQAALFGSVPSDMCVMTRKHSLPYSFCSLLEARQTLDDLLNRVYCLERHCHRLRVSQLSIEDPEIIETQSKIMSDLSLWRKIYKALLIQIEANGALTEKFGSRLLNIYYELAVIMASVCPSEDEMIFDSFTKNFLGILTGFVDLWNYWASQDPDVEEMNDLFVYKIENHGFTVESGFIPPVYYTALKCRIPGIRRQAIRFLRSAPHREGVWNGKLLAEVLEEVVRIEESELGPAQLGSTKEFPLSEITASSRISGVSVILPNRAKDDTFVRYRKRIDNGQWVMFELKIMYSAK